jgi:hypothetical protein
MTIDALLAADGVEAYGGARNEGMGASGSRAWQGGVRVVSSAGDGGMDAAGTVGGMKVLSAGAGAGVRVVSEGGRGGTIGGVKVITSGHAAPSAGPPRLLAMGARGGGLGISGEGPGKPEARVGGMLVVSGACATEGVAERDPKRARLALPF